MKIKDYLVTLSDESLLKISSELKESIIPEDALTRQVINETDLNLIKEGHLQFIGLGMAMVQELAHRLWISKNI